MKPHSMIRLSLVLISLAAYSQSGAQPVPGTFVQADFDRPSQFPGSDLGVLYDNDWGAYWGTHQNANPGTPTVESFTSTGFSEINGQFARIARSHDWREQGNDVVTRALGQPLARDGDFFQFAIQVASTVPGSGWFVAQLQLQSSEDWTGNNHAFIGMSHSGWRVSGPDGSAIGIPSSIPLPEEGKWYWMRATMRDSTKDGQIDSYVVTIFDSEMNELGLIDNNGSPITFMPIAHWKPDAGPPEQISHMSIRAQGPGAFDILIDEITITIVEEPMPEDGIEAWRTVHFGTSENFGEAADKEDPDGDGVPNLLEYALGGNPLTPNRSVLPASSTTKIDESDFLTLGFTRPSPAPGDIIYRVMVSDDLVEWRETALPHGDPVEEPGGIARVVFRDPEPLEDSTRRFMKLLIQLTYP